MRIRRSLGRYASRGGSPASRARPETAEVAHILVFVCQGATAAARRGRFPEPGAPLDPEAAAGALLAVTPKADRALCGARLAARETGLALRRTANIKVDPGCATSTPASGPGARRKKCRPRTPRSSPPGWRIPRRRHRPVRRHPGRGGSGPGRCPQAFGAWDRERFSPMQITSDGRRWRLRLRGGAPRLKGGGLRPAAPARPVSPPPAPAACASALRPGSCPGVRGGRAAGPGLRP